MRKISFLTITAVALVLSAAASASAADRYAEPGGDGAVADCFSSDRCSLEDALDPAHMTDGSKVFMATGTYNVSTPLSITNLDIVLKGEGNASQTVINSSVAGSPALIINGGSEASKFTLNAASNDPGLDIASGLIDHVIVRNSASHGCTGTTAKIIESVCSSSGLSAAGLYSSAASNSLNLQILNSTIVAGLTGRGLDVLTSGPGHALTLSLASTIVYGPQPLALAAPSGLELDFHVETSNYAQLQRTIDGTPQPVEGPEAPNQAAAPIFTNAPGGDFTQAHGSPTIDAGSVSQLGGTTDVVGNARTQNGVPDIGAYESAPFAAVIPPATGGTTNPPAADTTRPTLTISKKPKSKITSRKVKVVFSANEPATFACKLDKGKWKACTSPYKATVKPGKHKLQIKATDLAKNVSAIGTVKFDLPK